MTQGKAQNNQLSEMDVPTGVEYLSAIDMRDEGIDLKEARSCTVTFDAIPIQSLGFLSTASPQQISSDPDKALSFLLLEAQIPSAVFELAMSFGGWCSILVSEIPIVGEGFYEATAIQFADDGQELVPKILYVKIKTSAPDAAYLRVLKRVTECRHHPNAPLDALEGQPKNDLFVAVYDVGQASMCAIIGSDYKPRAFFDFGWPISVKRWSLPSCQGFDPLAEDDPLSPAPVFLSHLDWDHWGYAYKSGRAKRDQDGIWTTHVIYRSGALERPWIMRRPSDKMKLGISHVHLLFSLQNQLLQDGSEALKFWPSARTQLQWGSCILFPCDPVPGAHDAKYLRNNRALGMLVENYASPYYRRVLLCGDADYTSIATKYKRNLGGIVAPHHGGRVTPKSIPAPDRDVDKYRYMVFSTHERCYSQIPSTDTITEARGLGWEISRTDERVKCCCGTGERRNRWFSLASTPSPGIRCRQCCCLI